MQNKNFILALNNIIFYVRTGERLKAKLNAIRLSLKLIPLKRKRDRLLRVIKKQLH